jgi:hypothetical protein
MDDLIGKLGGKRLVKIGLGDASKDLDEAFHSWSSEFVNVLHAELKGQSQTGVLNDDASSHVTCSDVKEAEEVCVKSNSNPSSTPILERITSPITSNNHLISVPGLNDRIGLWSFDNFIRHRVDEPDEYTPALLNLTSIADAYKFDPLHPRNR